MNDGICGRFHVVERGASWSVLAFKLEPCSQFKVNFYILSCFEVVMMINDGADELVEGEAT